MSFLDSTSGIQAKSVGHEAQARTALLEIRDHVSGWVNVKSYGAKGDGTTDDTVAILATLAAGLDVLFPAGTYMVSAALPLRNGQTVRGVGHYSTVVKTTSTTADVFQFTDIYQATLRDIGIQASGASTGSAISLTRGDVNNVSRVLVGVAGSSFSNGVLIRASPAVLDTVQVMRASGNAFYVTSLAGAASVNVRLLRTYAVQNTGVGYRIQGLIDGLWAVDPRAETGNSIGFLFDSNADGLPANSWLIQPWADDSTIDGFRFNQANHIQVLAPWSSNRGSGKNFYIGASAVGVRIVAGRMYNCNGHGIEIDGDQTTIVGTQIEQAGIDSANTYDGVRVGGNRTQLLGVGAVGTSTKYGVHVVSGATNYRVVGGNYEGATTDIIDEASDPNSMVAVTNTKGAISLGANMQTSAAPQVASALLDLGGAVTLTGQLKAVAGTVAQGDTLGTVPAFAVPNRNVLANALNAKDGSTVWVNVSVSGVVTCGIALVAGSDTLQLDAVSYRISN